MTFPLIQQRGPLQELADMLRSIREQQVQTQQAALERRQIEEQIRRSQAYLEMNQMQAQQGIKNDDLDRQRQREQDQLALTDRDFARDQARREAVRRGLPRNFTLDPRTEGLLANEDLLAGKEFTGTGVTPEAAGMNRAMREGERPVLSDILQRAQADAQPGVQGSYVRAPRLGTYGGATYDPGTVNVNLPSERSGGADNPLSQGAIARMLDATQRLNALQDQAGANATRPWSGTGRRVVAGAARRVLGADNDVTEGLEYSGFTPGQQDFQSIADEWTHQYIVFLPRFRSGRDMYNNVKHAYFPRTGVTDPNVINSFRQRRDMAMRSILAAHARGATPEQIEEMLVGDLNRAGVGVSGSGQPILPAVEPPPGGDDESAQVLELLRRRLGGNQP